MKILGINTALPLTEVGFLDGDKVLVDQSWRSNFDEAEKLLPALRKILAKQPKPDKIFVVTGPGAFTGLRIGITVANTLAFVYGVPVMACSTFEYLQQKMPAKYAKNTAIMMRAGSGVAVWLPQDKKIHRMKKEEVELFLRRKKSVRHVVSDVRKEAREEYPLPQGVRWLDLNELRSLPEAMKSILAERPEEHRLVKPQYLAPPHITKSKKPVFTL